MKQITYSIILGRNRIGGGAHRATPVGTEVTVQLTLWVPVEKAPQDENAADMYARLFGG